MQTYYQDNDDLGPTRMNLSQVSLYAGQLAFKVQWIAQFALSASYFYTARGETQINNVSQDNALQT